MVCPVLAGTGRSRSGRANARRETALGYGIEPAFAPRMTACKPPQCQPRPARHPEAAERSVGVLGTRRQIQAPAGRDRVQHRREQGLIQTESEPERAVLRARRLRGGISVLQRWLDSSHGGTQFPAGGRDAACCSRTLWIVRKTAITSRSNVAKSRSITLRRG